MYHNAPGAHTAAQIEAMKAQQEGRCFYCDRRSEFMEVDHFVPLSRGGSNWISNIVWACRNCNRRKTNKLPWEWRPDRFAAPSAASLAMDSPPESSAEMHEAPLIAH